MNIFIFSWNVQSIKYNNVDFINEFEKDFDIIVIALQEDAKNSCLIDDISKKLKNYSLIEKTELLGWGSTTYKALKKLQYVPRGLRLAVYKNKSYNRIVETTVSYHIFDGFLNQITWGKGAVSITLKIENRTICFVNTHFPFNSSSLNARKEYSMWQAKCLKTLYDNYFLSDVLFIIGDLNFRVDAEFSVYNTETLFQIYSKYDELRQYMNQPDFPEFFEGINNSGPAFLPTFKLFQDRDNSNVGFNIGKYGKRTPSWCDRILYREFSSLNTKCLMYDRYESGEMKRSDHSAVIGEFSVDI